MSQIHTTDLPAPFEVWEVQLGDRTIKFFEPLLLAPFWLEEEPDDSEHLPVNNHEYLGVEQPDLEIFANGTNRRELWNCLCGDIRSAWIHFVRVETPLLSPHGRRIKKSYLQIAEGIGNG